MQRTLRTRILGALAVLAVATTLALSVPKNFIDRTPPIVDENGGFWLDFWNVCDSAMCYLFGADDNGRVYRSETTIGEFPNGFRNTPLTGGASC